MPAKRTYKPRYKRKKKKVQHSLHGQSPQYPLGKKLKTNTRYFDKGFTLSLPPGNNANHVFCANGLYNPDITTTVGDHQPLGFDQMMLMFDHYTVIGARIRVDYWNKDPSNAVFVGISLNDDATPSLNPQVAIENGGCVYKQLSPFGAGVGARGSLTCKVNPAKWLGRSKPLADPDLKGNESSNPNESVFFSVFACDTGGDDATTVEFAATIEYTVVYTEPKELGTS